MTSEQQSREFLPDLCTPRSVLVIVVVAQLLAIVTTLTAALYEPFSFERLALSSLFIQWVALTSAAMLCGLRRVINAMPLGWAGLTVVMVVVMDAFCFSLLAGVALESVVDGLLLDRRVWLREAFISAAIAAIIGGLVMRYFYVQEQLRQKDEAALQARIQALQSRIRPHFLFNSMNIIASLISVDPDTAEQVVEDLSRLFRASLAETGSLVTLEHELSLVRRYIRIEQLRMGERLQVEWDVRLDPEKVTIPLLTLQPLVENALYHGIQPLAAGGTLKIGIWQEGLMVRILVSNPKPPGPSAHRGNQMALENIRHRLEALHDGKARVEVTPGQERYDVLLTYPLKGD
jgi:two-component system, LytTR family, sensor histidine kinase AlgZ